MFNEWSVDFEIMDSTAMQTLQEDYNKKLSSAELRKIKKPIIEKRRRCRINESLAQLKSLILEALNKDESQYNKMEKADILELTVKHLQNIHKEQQKVKMKQNTLAALASPLSSLRTNSSNPAFAAETPYVLASVQEAQEPLSQASENPDLTGKYKEGYTECMQEVTSYINSLAGVRQEVKEELTRHLSARVQTISTIAVVPEPQTLQTPVNGYVQILPKDTVVLGNSENQSAPVVQSLPCVQPLQLVNGQTIFLANTLPTLVQPQPVVQGHAGVCQLVDRAITQTDVQSMGSTLPKCVPSSRVFLPEQTTSPLQVVTYNLSPQLSSHVTANSQSLVSPQLETKSVIHASPQTLSPKTPSVQTPVSPIFKIKQTTEKVPATASSPLNVQTKQHPAVHSDIGPLPSPVIHSHSTNVKQSSPVKRNVEPNICATPTGRNSTKNDTLKTFHTFRLPQMNFHSVGMQEVSPTSDKMWRPW